MSIRLAACLAFLSIAARFPAPAHAFAPTSAYAERTVRGFTVLVNKAVAEHPDEERAALKELDAQLGEVIRVVPAGPLADLKKIRIWMEWESKPGGAAEFHPDEGWLKENGYNPEKVGGVEINNARNFVDWSRRAQPWMVLHELAHGYYFRALGDGYAPNEAAYLGAKAKKLYESVEYVGGAKQKAYAMTDPKEYFAELSEAYFGKNDFYPFTRAELERHDPEGFRVMERAWGRPKGDDAAGK